MNCIMRDYKKADKVRLVKSWPIPPGDNIHCTKEMEVIDNDRRIAVSAQRKDSIINTAQLFFPEQLIPSNAVIHTKTQAEYDKLMEELKRVGYRWASGKKPTSFDDWERDRDQTCINLESGKIRYGPKSFYEECNHPIIPFTDIFGEVEEQEAIVKIIFEYNYEHKPKKTMIQKLSDTMKRVLNEDIQAQYKANFRNGDLELTEEGRRALLDILAIEKEKELADKAREVIKEEEE